MIIGDATLATGVRRCYPLVAYGVTDRGSFLALSPGHREASRLQRKTDSCPTRGSMRGARGYHASTRTLLLILSPPSCSSAVSPTRTASKLADIPVADISEYVSRPDCFVWVAMFEPSQRGTGRNGRGVRLASAGRRRRPRSGHQRPKIEEYGDSLFAVLHTVEASSTPEGRRTLLIGRGRMSSSAATTYSSVRHRTQGGFAAVRARTRARARCCTARAMSFSRADGQRRRPLFPDPRRARDASSKKSRSRSSPRNRRAFKIEALYALKQTADGAEARGATR